MQRETAHGADKADASILRAPIAVIEQARARGVFDATLIGPREARRDEFLKLPIERREALVEHYRILCRHWHLARLAGRVEERRRIKLALDQHIIEQKWREKYPNVVTTEGGNYLLDTGLRNQAAIATWYLGLIAATGYTAVAAADTAAQINGTNQWKEAAGTTGPNYGAATRQALTVGNAAAAKSLASSATSNFTMSAAGTIKGTFLASSNVKDGVAGKLYSAGLFASGDKVLGNGDTLQVSYTASV
jgi:hypothetical protein